MPGFRFLPNDNLQAVVDYVIMLSLRGEVERQVALLAETEYAPEDEIESLVFTDALVQVHDAWDQANDQVTLPMVAPPKMTDETILAGRKAFLSRGCSKCHGEDGRGQTIWLSQQFIAAQQDKPEAEREAINYDVWQQPAPAADLTAGMLHGGRRPIDIYRRINNGINGTPMPGFEQALSGEPETTWHLVHYVLAVVDRRTVEGMENVVAEPQDTSSPATEE
jgi:mono/diheme cytochrome c family protein